VTSVVNMNIDTLLVWRGCHERLVQGTVRDASDLDYQVIMVEDACAAVTPELHQAAITKLKVGFCNLRNTAEVVKELHELAD
jgi:nicotinamidase-related amidase